MSMKILVAGSSGLVGSSLVRLLTNLQQDVILCNSKIIDLRNRQETFEFIHDVSPDAIIDAAAMVGGIGANSAAPVEFLSNNIQIQTNLMDAAHDANIEQFVFLGSSCIYPKLADQPIIESALLTGPLEETNKSYAIAKIAGIQLIDSYRSEYGRNWVSVMPTNLYGSNDNFDLDHGHVLPSLVNRFVTATKMDSPAIKLWGNGTPLREFLHADDFAQAIWFILNNYDAPGPINVGSGQEVSIAELAELIKVLTGYSGSVSWDTSKPNGTPRKFLDSSLIRGLGWTPKITLEEGLKKIIQEFEGLKMGSWSK